MTNIVSMVKLKIKPDSIAEFEEHFRKMVADVAENEPQAQEYSLLRIGGEPGAYRVIERYADAAATEFHAKRDSVRKNARKIGDYLAEPVTFETLEPVVTLA